MDRSHKHCTCCYNKICDILSLRLGAWVQTSLNLWGLSQGQNTGACHMKGIIATTCPCIISYDLSPRVPVLSFKQQLLAQEFILNCMGFTLLPQRANNYTALLKRSTSVWQNVTQNWDWISDNMTWKKDL